MTKKIITYSILLIMIPALVISGCIIFREKQYAFISATVTILACGAFFLSFEKKEHSAQTLTVIAVLTALCIVSRIIFSPLQSFKPVTALIIIAALHFGGEAGFMVGAMTALISNFYFSQGP
ncbi:MAG: ECF transporter S component, partial [Ruminococcus sp.]|nr:ECF transporter S component [Ruminococcus sp.]